MCLNGSREAIVLVHGKRRDLRASHTSRAAPCPTNPSPVVSAVPSGRRPRPLMCVCAAVLFSRELPFTSLIWTMVKGLRPYSEGHRESEWESRGMKIEGLELVVEEPRRADRAEHTSEYDGLRRNEEKQTVGLGMDDAEPGATACLLAAERKFQSINQSGRSPRRSAATPKFFLSHSRRKCVQALSRYYRPAA